MERRAESDAFAQALEPVILRLADVVAVVIENALAIIAFDGKNFLKDGLQADIFPAGRSHIELEKLRVGVGLEFNEIGPSDNLFDFSEVDSFCCSRWHFFYSSVGLTKRQAGCFG